MKKIICLSISVLLVCLCFASCGNKISEEEYVTDLAGKVFAAVTGSDGGEIRDEKGRIMVLSTDVNGNKQKDKNGEYITEPVTIEKALVVGNNIVMPYFSLTIPDGWENAKSFNSLQITRGDTIDLITISAEPGKTTQEIDKTNQKLLDSAKETFECKTYKCSIKIGETDSGGLSSVFVPVDGNGEQTYLGFIVFDHNDIAFRIMIKSNHDLGKDLGDFREIIDSIKFVD